jgi:CRISPR-associated protein Csd1
MSWLNVLYQTYENCYGIIEDTRTAGGKSIKPLLPPFHTLQYSHIEVIIDENGNFLDANFIEDKNDQEIIIPCTEKSASRTSGEEPHPLCDKIQYCAKDYSGNKKSYFNSFSKILGKWYSFDKENNFLKAIYEYVQKGNLCHDILNTGKEFGKPNQEFGNFLVRWKVNIPCEPENRCWKNHQLFESWQRFSESQESIEDICMVTGIKKSIAINHPKRIRNSGDGAKLISANDKSGFTFLGRFFLNDFKKEKISNQAASISVEISQKAHSALRWLIDRQSYRNGDQVIISWSITGEEKPNEFSDTNILFGDSDEEKIAKLNSYSLHDAGQTFARKLTKKIAGYRASLSDDKKIVVMGLDSAGPGRISIIFYRELAGSDFLDRVEKWHSEMA